VSLETKLTVQESLALMYATQSGNISITNRMLYKLYQLVSSPITLSDS